MGKRKGGTGASVCLISRRPRRDETTQCKESKEFAESLLRISGKHQQQRDAEIRQRRVCTAQQAVPVAAVPVIQGEFPGRDAR